VEISQSHVFLSCPTSIRDVSLFVSFFSCSIYIIVLIIKRKVFFCMVSEQGLFHPNLASTLPWRVTKEFVQNGDGTIIIWVRLTLNILTSLGLTKPSSVYPISTPNPLSAHTHDWTYEVCPDSGDLIAWTSRVWPDSRWPNEPWISSNIILEYGSGLTLCSSTLLQMNLGRCGMQWRIHLIDWH